MLRPAWMNQRQLDILMRYVPGPIGQGMSIKQIAADLNITRRSVERSLATFKMRFPDAFERVMSMRRGMNAHRIGMKNKHSMEGLISAVGFEEFHDMIRDYPEDDSRPTVEIAIEREECESK